MPESTFLFPQQQSLCVLHPPTPALALQSFHLHRCRGAELGLLRATSQYYPSAGPDLNVTVSLKHRAHRNECRSYVKRQTGLPQF